MKCRGSFGGVLAALAFVTPLLAQNASPPDVSVTPPTFLPQSFTTGMVGFTTNQTVRLNVLNLNSVPTSTTATPMANCTIELQFFDAKNNLVKQALVPNFGPGTATSLDLPRASVTSENATRAEIRGVVVVNPSTPVASPVAPGYCIVMTTLEIFDTTTNSTVVLTSDTRAVGLPNVRPVVARGRG